MLIFLLAVLPLQFAWGAAVTYCRHEQGAAVGHFGHHSHKHQAEAKGETQSVSADQKVNPLADDPDCVAHHMGCVPPIGRSPPLLTAELSADLVFRDAIAEAASPPVSIERPKWSRAA